MTLVLDAPMTVALLLEDEELPLTAESLRRLQTEVLVVPPHWALEVANALLSNERSGRIMAARFEDSIERVRQLDVEVLESALDQALIAAVVLARHYRLTTYDAAYLRAAMRSAHDLATLDGALRRAAIEAGVVVLAQRAPAASRPSA